LTVAVHPRILDSRWTWGVASLARTLRDSKLETREARRKLQSRGKPYYRLIDSGLHLGYRKGQSGAGKWVVRQYAGGQAYLVETIASADDVSDANGVGVLNFSQAQARARALRDERSRASGWMAAYTVNDAMAAYLTFLEHERASVADARYRHEAFIRRPFGDTEIAFLKAKKIRDWHRSIIKIGPRLRTKKGHEQRYAGLGSDTESKRRRRVSANRTLMVLKAALNMAWRDGHAPSDAEWRRVKPFEGTDAARVRYITIAEAKRLLNACEPDFRLLVQAALESGSRYGHLVRLRVSDFNPDTGIISIHHTAQNKRGGHVVLSDEGLTFFRQVCAGRPGNAVMFNRADGTPWLRSHQGMRMKAASHKAKIEPPISFHVLRHTWASLAAMNGVPLMVIAKNLGHTDTRMVERHYGHLAPSYIADAIRAGAPRFGFKPDRKIAELGR